MQALAELKGHFFTLVKNGEKYETREVKIGSTNDKVATIESGLKEGDEVVMNPRSAGSLLEAAEPARSDAGGQRTRSSGTSRANRPVQAGGGDGQAARGGGQAARRARKGFGA